MHQKVEIQSGGGGSFQVYDFRTQHQKVEVQSLGGGGPVFGYMIFGLGIKK